MTREALAALLIAIAGLALAAACARQPEPDYAGEELVCEWQTRPQYVGAQGGVRVKPERSCRSVPARAKEPPPLPDDLKPGPPAPRIEVESEESAPEEP